jgi:hypothetical protein
MEEVEKSRSILAITHCAHIFPQFTNLDVSGSIKDSGMVRSHVLPHPGYR